jgi:hypothetical protein
MDQHHGEAAGEREGDPRGGGGGEGKDRRRSPGLGGGTTSASSTLEDIRIFEEWLRRSSTAVQSARRVYQVCFCRTSLPHPHRLLSLALLPAGLNPPCTA